MEYPPNLAATTPDFVFGAICPRHGGQACLPAGKLKTGGESITYPLRKAGYYLENSLGEPAVI